MHMAANTTMIAGQKVTNVPEICVADACIWQKSGEAALINMYDMPASVVFPLSAKGLTATLDASAQGMQEPNAVLESTSPVAALAPNPRPASATP